MKDLRKESGNSTGGLISIERSPSRFAGVWFYLAASVAALIAAIIIYGSSLHGPFVFDDTHLPFLRPDIVHQPILVWLRGPRPFLILTFWANYRLFDVDPYSYHWVNIFLHVINSVLLFLIAKKLLQLAGTAGARVTIVAGFVAGLFLVHPLQTEAVTYVASRSETLSLTFIYGALIVFLYRRNDAIGWRAAAAVLLLFVLALGSKEHAIALFGVLLLTDYFWNPGFSWLGIRRNWRLYGAALFVGSIVGWYVVFVFRTAKTMGFTLKDVTWYQYLFTQFRVIWRYLRLFLIPYGQTIDPDVRFSRTLFDYGAIFGLLALVAVTVAAFVWRRRFPLAAYGWLTFLILLAPTSSVIALSDASAEHRLYLPMIGLLLIVAEALRTCRLSDKFAVAIATVALLIFGAAAQARNQVWANAITLWQDAVAKAPHKQRPHFQLAYAYQKVGRCADAIHQYQAAWQAGERDGGFLADWGLAYNCNNQPDEAIAKLREAAAKPMDRFNTAHIWSLIGMVYDEHGQTQEALDALSTGEHIEPNAQNIYMVRGTLLARNKRFSEADTEFRRVLDLNPYHQEAQFALRVVDSKLAGDAGRMVHQN